ncbi:MFS transporter [Paenibacillus thalictri]|uniref:MFS transporter n=1 Tax=Paenibacillus thalictri TaxID=2527873 RepID=A0A4Q9DYN5_9BACL|nr:MFS transporter [Paenibacillus thalictri]TBL81516.1 MFS transporter [Paenibacillus thalictri]
MPMRKWKMRAAAAAHDLTPQERLYAKVGIWAGLVFFTVTSVAQPFFSLYAESLGASTAEIGLLVMLRSLLPLFIAMPVGQLIDSLGAMTMSRVGFLSLVLSLLLMAGSVSPLWLGLSQVLMGASIIISSSSLQVLVSGGGVASRNRSINNYSMAMSAGGMLGPLLGGAVVSMAGGGTDAYREAFWLALACSIAAALLLIIASTLRREKVKKADHTAREAVDAAAGAGGGLETAPEAAGSAAETEAPATTGSKPGAGRASDPVYSGSAASAASTVRDAFRLSRMLDSYASGFRLSRLRGVRFGLAGTFLIMFIQALSMSFMPLFLNSAGYAAWQISLIVSLNGLAGLLSRFCLDSLIRRAGLEKLLLAAGGLAAACLVVIPPASLHGITFAVLTIVLGGAVGLNLPVSIMIMVNDTGDGDRGKVMGLRLLANRVSQLMSPAMFGFLGQTLGLSAAFYTGGAVLLAAVAGFTVASGYRPRWKNSEAASARRAGSVAPRLPDMGDTPAGAVSSQVKQVQYSEVK